MAQSEGLEPSQPPVQPADPMAQSEGFEPSQPPVQPADPMQGTEGMGGLQPGEPGDPMAESEGLEPTQPGEEWGQPTTDPLAETEGGFEGLSPEGTMPGAETESEELAHGRFDPRVFGTYSQCAQEAFSLEGAEACQANCLCIGTFENRQAQEQCMLTCGSRSTQ
jgi:hypothetical protein